MRDEEMGASMRYIWGFVIALFISASLLATESSDLRGIDADFSYEPSGEAPCPETPPTNTSIISVSTPTAATPGESSILQSWRAKLCGHPSPDSCILRLGVGRSFGFISTHIDPENECRDDLGTDGTLCVYEVDLANPAEQPKIIFRREDQTWNDCNRGTVSFHYFPSAGHSTDWLGILYWTRYAEEMHLYALKDQVGDEKLNILWTNIGTYKDTPFNGDQSLLLTSGKGSVDWLHFPDRSANGCYPVVLRKHYQLDASGRLMLDSTVPMTAKETAAFVSRVKGGTGLASSFGTLDVGWPTGTLLDGFRVRYHKDDENDGPDSAFDYLNQLRCLTGEDYGNTPAQWDSAFKAR